MGCYYLIKGHYLIEVWGNFKQRSKDQKMLFRWSEIFEFKKLRNLACFKQLFKFLKSWFTNKMTDFELLNDINCYILTSKCVSNINKYFFHKFSSMISIERWKTRKEFICCIWCKFSRITKLKQLKVLKTSFLIYKKHLSLNQFC